MFTRLSTAVAALLVAVWLVYQGLGLAAFAKDANAAYASSDHVEVLGTVTDTGSVPFVPRDSVLIEQPTSAAVRVVPDPDGAVEIGQPRTVLVDPDDVHIARYEHVELTRPGDRYYLVGGLALLVAAGFAAAGVRMLVRAGGQLAEGVDEDRVRFVGHHRHGA